MQQAQQKVTTTNPLLHGLEVVGLLDLGLAVLAHRLAQLVSLGRRLEVVLDVAALLSGQVDGLLRQRDLWREGLDVARGQDLCLEGLLFLGCGLALLLGLGCAFCVLDVVLIEGFFWARGNW